MARLTDAHIFEQIRLALSDSQHSGPYSGVLWERLPATWLLENLEVSQREVVELMLKHVSSGGKVDQVPEKGALYRDIHEFHYDFLIRIEGQIRYIETRLINDSRVQPAHILIVNMHD